MVHPYAELLVPSLSPHQLSYEQHQLSCVYQNSTTHLLYQDLAAQSRPHIFALSKERAAREEAGLPSLPPRPARRRTAAAATYARAPAVFGTAREVPCGGRARIMCREAPSGKRGRF